MQRIKKAYAESGDLKIIPDTPPLDGSESWEQGRGAYYELDNDPSTGDPLALDIDREQDNYFKNVISKNIKHWQENSYPIWFNDIKYPKNAIVKYTDGNIYASKVANNTELPTNATNWTIYDPSSLDGQFVKLTENQTIEDVKTFTSSPIVPTPTTDFQVTNKQYVDSKTLNINSLSNKPIPINTDNFVLQEVGGDLKKVSYANLIKLNPNDIVVKTALNASGTAPIYACRAWVNFNGTGTVAIRASGNVSSITDNGVGDYTVNFATAMPNSNYNVALSASNNIKGLQNFDHPYNFLTTSISASTREYNTNHVDRSHVTLSVTV